VSVLLAAAAVGGQGDQMVVQALAARLGAGRPARHGGMDLRVVATREELDAARQASDALDALLRHAIAKVPVDALRTVAAATDVILLEAGRVPDQSDRLDTGELRQAGADELRRRGL